MFTRVISSRKELLWSQTSGKNTRFCSRISLLDLLFRNRAMLNNETDYPDPSSFKPERYLKNGQLDPNVRDPALMAFGFGRRQVVLRGTCVPASPTSLDAKIINQDMPRDAPCSVSIGPHGRGRAFDFQHI